MGSKQQILLTINIFYKVLILVSWSFELISLLVSLYYRDDWRHNVIMRFKCLDIEGFKAFF